MYVGFWVTDRPEAIGTMDRPATRLEKYRSLALSLDCIWRTESSHERGVRGLNGEHGLFTWMIWRVEERSGVLHVLGRALESEMKNKIRSEKWRVVVVFFIMFVLVE